MVHLKSTLNMADRILVIIAMWLSMCTAIEELQGTKKQVFDSFAASKELLELQDFSRATKERLEKKIDYWSWSFGDTNSNPWTAFIFTLTSEKKIDRFCGATIFNNHMLFTSCACVRSYFFKYAQNYQKSFTPKDHIGVGMSNLDLGDPLGGKYYVWNSNYKSTWYEEHFRGKKNEWPWRLTLGENYEYLKRNYRCWEVLFQDCQPYPRGAKNPYDSSTCNETDKHIPWESRSCPISTVAILGITPIIDNMPQLPWPPKPELYYEANAFLKLAKTRRFWTIKNYLRPYEHHGMTVSSYFLRLVNDTNHLIDEYQERQFYLPHMLINYQMVVCDQLHCAGKEYSLYMAELLTFHENNNTCLCAYDPLYRQGIAADWGESREVLRLCGGDIGFPVFSSKGFHGITVTSIDCENRARRPPRVVALPFDAGVVQYVESVMPELTEQKAFKFERYDIIVPQFELINDPQRRDPDLYFYRSSKKKGKKSRGCLSYKEGTLKQFISITVVANLALFYARS